MCQKETQIPRVTNFSGEFCEQFSDNCGDFGIMDEFLEKNKGGHLTQITTRLFVLLHQVTIIICGL